MKDEVIRIRISAEDKEKVKEKAESLGLTVSAYISMLIHSDIRGKR